jgi:hypothetical protein
MAVVLLAACSESMPTIVDEAEVFRPLDLRVISAPAMVVVYAREPERPCSCENGDFPELGMCARTSDILSCTCEPAPAFCIHRIAVESEGRVLAEYLRADHSAGEEVYLLVPELQTVSAPQLVVDGCGARAEIPVGGPGPQPTITTTSRTPEDRLRVDWTTDRPPASSIAMVNSGFSGQRCQVVAMTHDFEPIPAGTRLDIEVFGLDPPVPRPTPFGDALVYPAGLAYQALVVP